VGSKTKTRLALEAAGLPDVSDPGNLFELVSALPSSSSVVWRNGFVV